MYFPIEMIWLSTLATENGSWAGIMKVKTIANMREDWFDDEINEFIQHKHIVDIKFSVLFDSNDDSYIFSALITYEEVGI